VCVLRLSALGDVCHALPVVRTLQALWPRARFTWILGAAEARLIGDIPEIEFVVFDKSQGLFAYPALRAALRGRRFDLLLHMQNSLRGNAASLMVSARLRLGFDRRLTKDHQAWFTNRKAPYRERAHVMDALFTFAEWCGATERVLRWDIPIPAEARAFAERELPGSAPTLAISPCANPRPRNWRNWTPEGYAAVARHALERMGLRVVVTGGRSVEERRFADAIAAATGERAVDLVGRSGLKELLAVLERSRALVCPDSGPAHMATAIGTPVVGLFATTNPERAAPYFSRRFCVDKYAEAAQAEFGVPVELVPFGRRVRNPAAMARIRVEDVVERLEALFEHSAVGSREA
jgi:heptosyltransferase I